MRLALAPGGLARLAAVAALALAVGACMAERPGPPVISPTKIGTLGVAPVKGAAARFAFSRVTSVPGEFVYALEDSLKSAAAKLNLALVPEDDPTATYRVKGYLSAIGDANGILLVYVFDVFDAAGGRVHRVSGQRKAPGRGADPWSGVDNEMIEAVAQEAIDTLAAWIRA